MPPPTAFPRVAFNLMSARVGGGLTYAISQTRAFLQIWPHERIIILTSPWNDDALSTALDHSTLCLPARSAFDRYMREQALPLGILRKHNIDVLYGIGNFLPLTPLRCRTVMALQNPNYVGEGRRLRHNNSFGEQARMRLSHQSMRRADLVITISNALETAMRSEPGLDRIRTRVILSGGPDWSIIDSDPAFSKTVGGRPFFLSVANDYPHKRLDDIVCAFALSSTTSVGPMNLVLVGQIELRRQSALMGLAGTAASSLIFLGSLRERGQVKWLYEHAWAAVSASELEAFPLTPAEAACLRCPLILTDIPPHLEVAKGAGLHFKVGDTRVLARYLSAIASQRSRQPAEAWNWPTTWSDNATQLSEAICEVAY